MLLAGMNPALGIDTAAELEATRQALRALEAEQESRLRAIDRIEERIAEAAGRSQDLRREQRVLEQEIASRDQGILLLEDEVRQREAELDRARATASLMMREQWMLQRHQSGLRGDDGSDIRHRRLIDGRVQIQREQTIRETAERLSAFADAHDRLARARAVLANRESQIRDLLQGIERQDAEHAALLDRARREITHAELDKEHLQRNAQTLERELRRLELLAVPSPPPTAARSEQVAAQRFAAQKGRLPRPVEGRVLHRYGGPRDDGLHGRWRGDVFAVTGDTAVRAVHQGKTIYADWMRGFGFLVILDHGDGYLSLYANNRELLASAGQSVERGDVIARAGLTSPVIAPGLYFELRHQGRTLNPAGWWNSK